MSQDALIVAHGQPSDPDGPEAEIALLADRVAAFLPGWRVRGATLAAPGALEVALDGLTAPRIFPFFMSDGWFIRSNLPARLAAAGNRQPDILLAFGLWPATNDLAVRLARTAAADAGWAEAATVLILAAHGSGRSPQPAETARDTAGYIGQRSGFADIRTCFIEQDPRLVQGLRDAGAQALCLPLFVARWGHVVGDLPAAVKKAGFGGIVLAPLGHADAVPGLIAAAIGETADSNAPRRALRARAKI